MLEEATEANEGQGEKGFIRAAVEILKQREYLTTTAAGREENSSNLSHRNLESSDKLNRYDCLPWRKLIAVWIISLQLGVRFVKSFRQDASVSFNS